jgi:hypothetical protein
MICMYFQYQKFINIETTKAFGSLDILLVHGEAIVIEFHDKELI